MKSPCRAESAWEIERKPDNMSFLQKGRHPRMWLAGIQILETSFYGSGSALTSGFKHDGVAIVKLYRKGAKLAKIFVVKSNN